MASDRNKCLDAGCTDYLTKPIRSGALYTALAEFLPVRSSHEPLRSIASSDAVLAELMGECTVELKQNTERLGTQLRTGDLRGAADVAHRLKGTAATFGFPGIAALAGEIERLARGNHGSLIAAIYDRLNEEVARIEAPAPQRE